MKDDAKKCVDLLYKLGKKYKFIEHDQFDDSISLEYIGDFEYISIETDENYDKKSRVIYKRDIEPIAKQFLNDFFENVNCTNIFNNNWWNWLEDYPIIEIPFTEDYIKYRKDNGYLRYDF